MHRMRAVLLALLMTALFCCGCGDDENVVKGAGHSFSYCLVGNPDTLDPQLAENASAKTVLANLFEGLLTLDADGSLKNGVCESYEISDDRLHYTFHLRQDSYWFDAYHEDSTFCKEAERCVTAQDFVFAFQRLFDPDYGSANAAAYSCIANAREIMARRLAPSSIGVTAKSDSELEFTLDYPNTGFLMLLTAPAAMPCNQEYFENSKGRYGLDEASVIGNGSFAMQRWLYDPYGKYNVVQLVRNPLNHAVQRIFPTDLNFYIEESDADAAAIFTEGNADCYVTTQNSLVGRSEYSAEGSYSITFGLIANPDSHFADANVRQAMALTLDRSQFPADSHDIRTASGILPPGTMMLNKSCRELISDTVYQKYDPPEADRLYHKAMRKLRISELEEGRVLVCSGMMDYALLAEVLDIWRSELDLHFSIEEVTEPEYEARLASGDYALALYAVTGAYHDAPAVFESVLADSMLNCSGAATVRGLLEKAAAMPNQTDCVELYRQAEEAILADNCFIPLFYKQRYLICKRGVSDVVFNPFSGQVQFSGAKFYN